jgi:hypothetical protein
VEKANSGVLEVEIFVKSTSSRLDVNSSAFQIVTQIDVH